MEPPIQVEYFLSATWTDDLDLCVVGDHRADSLLGGELLLQAVSETREHGGTTGQDNVGEKVVPDINITPHNRVMGDPVVDVESFWTKPEGWLEEKLRAPEHFVADSDHLAVGKLVSLLQRCGGGGGLHLLLEVKSDIAEFLLDVTGDIPG